MIANKCKKTKDNDLLFVQIIFFHGKVINRLRFQQKSVKYFAIRKKRELTHAVKTVCNSICTHMECMNYATAFDVN